ACSRREAISAPARRPAPRRRRRCSRRSRAGRAPPTCPARGRGRRGRRGRRRGRARSCGSAWRDTPAPKPQAAAATGKRPVSSKMLLLVTIILWPARRFWASSIAVLSADPPGPHGRADADSAEPLSRAEGRLNMEIIPSGRVLGASVEGLDLSRPLEERRVEELIQALGRYGVLRFPHQRLGAREQKDFAARFGELEINVAGAYQEPGIPEVMILSNIVKDGKPIGLADAGQDWHTDMSYSRMIAFANVLYALEVPQRNGKPLGATEFASMHAAYEGLPLQIKHRLEGMSVLHDFDKFWEMMRNEKGSKRPPLTEAQKKAKPPVSHPIFLKHPITGRKVLYANPGYSMRINELPQKESDR